MKCPVCSIDLTMSERNGVEIDYCSKCRGVWLDRGELDKIIERANVLPEQHAGLSDQAPYQNRPFQQQYGSDNYKMKKRKNFLDDIFDF